MTAECLPIGWALHPRLNASLHILIVDLLFQEMQIGDIVLITRIKGFFSLM